VGGARAHVPHRAFVLQHYRESIGQGARPVALVEGRVPAPCKRGIAARDPRRARMGAREREAHGAGPRTRRSTI
jgi:hypothetical protein